MSEPTTNPDNAANQGALPEAPHRTDQVPHPVALAGTVAAMLFGIFAAVFGVLPWWVGVGIVGAAASFATVASKIDRLPLRALELLLISVGSVLLAFAARGIGDTLKIGHPSYSFRIAGGYRVPVYFEPVQSTETTEAYSLGDEVTVRCRYINSHGQVWYSILGALNDINNPWLPASDVVPDFPGSSGRPPVC
jgi:hypothetical protein